MGAFTAKERSRMTNEKVTIKDVANDSGVSITTVSQILNGNGGTVSGKQSRKSIGCKRAIKLSARLFCATYGDEKVRRLA